MEESLHGKHWSTLWYLTQHTSVSNLHYQLQNCKAYIPKLFCCNVSCRSNSPLSGAAVKEGMPFRACSNVQVAEPRNSFLYMRTNVQLQLSTNFAWTVSAEHRGMHNTATYSLCKISAEIRLLSHEPLVSPTTDTQLAWKVTRSFDVTSTFQRNQLIPF
jgi:hypothetical protein